MKVAIIGLGKLGLPMAAVVAAKNHLVIGVDSNIHTVESINQGVAPILEPGLQKLLTDLPPGQFTATTDLRLAVEASELSVIMVPTPSLSDGRFDGRMVQDVILQIGKTIKTAALPFHTIVVGSTVMPGWCDDVATTTLKGCGLDIGSTVGLVYSPELIALGSVIYDLTHPDLVLVGTNDPQSAIAYDGFCRSISGIKPIHMSTLEAEISKLAINCYITTKISFANMLGTLCELHGSANPHLVAFAVGQDSRIGNKYFKPGGPFGGPCFPRDGRAFVRDALDHGGTAVLMEATQQVNKEVVTRLAMKCVISNTVAILGLTYKVDSPVTDEALGTLLQERLKHTGVRVLTHDPLIAPGKGAQSVVDLAECIVIATQWPEYATLNYDRKYVIDVWGLLSQ